MISSKIAENTTRCTGSSFVVRGKVSWLPQTVGRRGVSAAPRGVFAAPKGPGYPRPGQRPGERYEGRLPRRPNGPTVRSRHGELLARWAEQRVLPALSPGRCPGLENGWAFGPSECSHSPVVQEASRCTMTGSSASGSERNRATKEAGRNKYPAYSNAKRQSPTWANSPKNTVPPAAARRPML